MFARVVGASVVAVAAASFAWAGNPFQPSWVFGGCAGPEGAGVFLETCLDPVLSCETSSAQFLVTVPGTLSFDLSFTFQGGSAGPFFQVTTTSGGSVFSIGQVFGGNPPWCGPGPCSGAVSDVTFPVQAGDFVRVSLDAQATGCLPNCGTRCVLDGFTLVPTPGILPVGAALDLSVYLEVPGEPTTFGGLVFAVAALGDVDGDGAGDLVQGLPFEGTPGQPGIVRVVSGATGALHFQKKGTVGQGKLGVAVANAGDLDGDGADDVLASETAWPSSFQQLGRVLAWSGATGQPILEIPGDGSGFAEALAGAGDVDRDGVPDVVVGVPFADGPAGVECGAVRVYSGATGALLHERFGDQPDLRLGRVVSGAGDANADGYADFAAGAEPAPGFPGTSVVRTWSGRSGALLQSYVSAPGASPVQELDAAGDFDGDGRDDLVAGAPLQSSGAGVLRVLSGAGGVLLELPGAADEHLGSGVAGLGDVDGDGYDDVAVGAPGFQSVVGRVLVLRGPAGATHLEASAGKHADFGGEIDGGADVNGDGLVDLVVLAGTSVTGMEVLVVSGDPADHQAPTLAGAGPLLPGTPLTITLADAPPGAPGLLAVGFSVLAQPLLGGVLVPSPDVVIPLVADAAGGWSTGVVWPGGLGAPFFVLLQAWLDEPAAAQGVVATQGLLVAPH